MINPIADTLRRLPQFSRIRREDAQRWISHVANQQPDRILWLMDRLGCGFGGSETGALLLDAMGRPPLFKSAAELINEKLMRILPTPSNKFMRKGTTLEEATQLATLKLYGGEVDNRALEAFKQPHTNDPFGMGGNPDFPWIRRDGIRTLVDIKVPGAGEETLSNGDKAFYYQVQLNQYNILNDARGLPAFDQLMNIHLELPPVLTDAFVDRLNKGGRAELGVVVDEMVALLKYDRPGMRLHMVEQPINPEIDFIGQRRKLNDLIKEVCAVKWQAVLDGNIPELEERADIELSDANKTELAKKETELLHLQALLRATETKVQNCQLAIDAICEGIKNSGALSQTSHLNISRKASVDEDLAGSLLQRYNVDLDSLRGERAKLGVRDYDTLAMAEKLKSLETEMAPFIKPAPLDLNKIIEKLENLGENPARFITYKTSILTSRKKETTQLMQHMTERLAPVVETSIVTSISDDLAQQAPELSSPNYSAIGR